MDDLISRQAAIDTLAEWNDVAINNRTAFRRCGGSGAVQRLQTQTDRFEQGRS